MHSKPSRNILLLIFWLCLTGLSAQDTLYFRSGKKEVGKVLEVSQSMVTYSVLVDGVNIKMSQSLDLINQIVYSNGYTDHFNASGQQEVKVPAERLYKNCISLYPIPLIDSEVALQYSRIFPKLGFSILLPVNIMFTDTSLFNNFKVTNSYQWKKNVDVGISIVFHKKLKSQYYYFGPSFRYIQQEVRSIYDVLDYNGNLYHYVQQGAYSRYCFAITTGAHLKSKSHLSVEINLSLGFKHDVFTEYMYIPFTDTPILATGYPNTVYARLGLMLVGFDF